MSKAARFALLIILLHATVAALHGAAHRILNVEVSRPQILFIGIVIIIAPLMAGILILTSARAAGILIFTLSMAGSLIFGVYNHFVLIGPDHVFHLAGEPGSAWVTMFQLTAVLLALSEGLGVVTGIMMLKKGSAPVWP